MTCCTVSRSLRLLWVLATAALAADRSVDKRSAQTEVQCSSGYNWAGNSESLSPCLLTAVVWGACFNDGWSVPVLQPGNQYGNPNTSASTVNLCTCSWAAYNLISACTACQGLDASVQFWPAYDQDCTGFLTDTYFPSNVALPSGTKIPFWASTNPTTWMNVKFSSLQAQALANEGKPDLVLPVGQDSGGGKAKGAIVGGVVGGAAVLAIGAAIVFWLIRKSTRHGVGQPRILRRSMSDPSQRSIHTPENMSFAHRHPGDAYSQSLVVHRHGVGQPRILPRSMPDPSHRSIHAPEDMSFAHRHPGDTHPLPHVLMNRSSGRVMSEESFARRTLRDAYNNHQVAAALAATSTTTVEHSEPGRPNLRAYTLDPFRSMSESPEPTDLYS